MKNIISADIIFENEDKISLNLYPDTAPISVENFVDLANSGYYDGLIFHRNIPNFMIQGGGFKPGLIDADKASSIKGEFKANGVDNTLSHNPGVISMARTSVPNSASSQFFVCVADCTFLDGQYAAFGECADEESLALAIKLSNVRTTTRRGYDDVPTDDIVIKTITIN